MAGDSATVDRRDLLRWERDLAPGDEVRVRWGYGLGFRVSGRARIVKINPKSFRVALLERVASPYSLPGAEGWPEGFEFRVPKILASEWHPDHCVEPLDEVPGP